MIVHRLVLQNPKIGQEQVSSNARYAKAEGQPGLQDGGREVYEDPCVVDLKNKRKFGSANYPYKRDIVLEIEKTSKVSRTFRSRLPDPSLTYARRVGTDSTLNHLRYTTDIETKKFTLTATKYL
jgi:hypothetical protein